MVRFERRFGKRVGNERVRRLSEVQNEEGARV